MKKGSIGMGAAQLFSAGGGVYSHHIHTTFT